MKEPKKPNNTIDRTHRWVDDELEKVNDQLISLYNQSTKSIRKEWDAFFKQLDEQIQPFVEAIDKSQAGEKAKAKQLYKKEYLRLTIKNQAFMKMVSKTSKKITKVNKKACNITNSKMNNVYVQNYNYAEKVIRNKQARKITLKEVNEVEPLEKKTINAKKDNRWNVKNLCSVALRGSIGDYSKEELTAGIIAVIIQNRKSSYRNAKDMFTYAENCGRFDSIDKANDEGYQVDKKWSATLDNATRESHQRLDGEIVSVDDTFSNGCEYPRDPNGEPAEIYNCRCSLVPVTNKSPSSTRMERDGDLTGSFKKGNSFSNTESKIIDYLSYKDWWEGKHGK